MTEAVILAGGLGTRLRGVVPDLPKPMAPVNGRPFLEHQLDYWIGQGVTRFVLSVGYRSDAITSHFGTSYRGVALAYEVEETPLGTGGGLLKALDRLDTDAAFVLLNGDTFFEVNGTELMRVHAARQAQWSIALFRATERDRYMAVKLAADGRIDALRSGTAECGDLANGGVYVVEPAALRALPWAAGAKLSLEDDVLPGLMSTGCRVFGHECSGRFVDIGVPHDYARAREVLAA